MWKAIKEGIVMIAGWFTGTGAISSFFAWLGFKFTSKAAIVSLQIATIVALFLARVAFLIAVLDASLTTFNFINSTLAQIPDLASVDPMLSLAFNVMRSIGLVDAMKEAFAIFNLIFVALLVAFVAKFAFHVAKITSDEFFKLGVLLQV